jgi:hypothetical protein
VSGEQLYDNICILLEHQKQHNQSAYASTSEYNWLDQHMTIIGGQNYLKTFWTKKDYCQKET